MHTAASHRIRRLRWHIRTPSADAALAVRANLREWLPDIEAALQAAFDQQGWGGEVRRLDSLNLTLKLPDAFTQQDLMRELGSVLGQALHDAAHDMAAPDVSAIGPSVREPAEAGKARHLTSLLCALQAARSQAPGAMLEALRRALMAVDEVPRTDGLCALEWLGQGWDVRTVDVAHWVSSLSKAMAQQGLYEAGRVNSPVDIKGPRAKAGEKAPDPAEVQPESDLSKHASRSNGRTGAESLPTPSAAASVPVRGDDQAARDRRALAAHGAPTLTGVLQMQEQLMHYLRTGQLSWVLAGLPDQEAQVALREAAGEWETWGLIPDAQPSGSPMAQRLGALSRWLALLTEDQRQRVYLHHMQVHMAGRAGRHAPFGAQDLAKVWADSLPLMAHGGTTASADKLHALALCLDWMTAGGAGLMAASERAWLLEATSWVEALRRQGPSSDAWQALSNSWTAKASVQEGGREGHPEALPMVSQHWLPEARPQSSLPAPDALAGKAQLNQLAKAALAAREPRVSNGQIVAQAGLVLLHAYLPRCLDVLGLYPSGQRGPMADHLWPRAAAVLHWLATGQDGALECELGLIKPLLGRAERDALSHGLPTLLPHEHDEADALLRAVLGHWRALKGTSVNGLRESFLQRRGWLEARDGASLLRVEPAPYDVLLGSLPWGMSLVRLPWMSRPLHVEWSAP